MKPKLIILLTLVFQVSVAQFTNIDVVAKIKTEKIDNTISIISTATNTTEV